jgi:sulfur carrier protein
MNLTINGERREFPEAIVASELLNRLEISSGRVVVQLNLKVLRREQLDTTKLEEGDVIEIIQFVGGG